MMHGYVGTISQVFKYYQKHAGNDIIKIPEIWQKHVGNTLPFNSQSVNKSVDGISVFKRMAADLQEAVYQASVKRVSAACLIGLL
jgi:hypothetical protein